MLGLYRSMFFKRDLKQIKPDILQINGVDNNSFISFPRAIEIYQQSDMEIGNMNKRFWSKIAHKGSIRFLRYKIPIYKHTNGRWYFQFSHFLKAIQELDQVIQKSKEIDTQIQKESFDWLTQKKCGFFSGYYTFGNFMLCYHNFSPSSPKFIGANYLLNFYSIRREWRYKWICRYCKTEPKVINCPEIESKKLIGLEEFRLKNQVDFYQNSQRSKMIYSEWKSRELSHFSKLKQETISSVHQLICESCGNNYTSSYPSAAKNKIVRQFPQLKQLVDRQDLKTVYINEFYKYVSPFFYQKCTVVEFQFTSQNISKTFFSSKDNFFSQDQ